MAAILPDPQPSPEIEPPFDAPLLGRSALLVEAPEECLQVMHVAAGEHFHSSHRFSLTKFNFIF
jgi:hypothetical protein